MRAFATTFATAAILVAPGLVQTSPKARFAPPMKGWTVMTGWSPDTSSRAGTLAVSDDPPGE